MNFKGITNLFKITSVQIWLLILLTVICYGNTLQNGFAWDDSDFFEYWFAIKDSKSVSAIYSLPDLLAGELPDAHRGVYRPVRSVYYLFSYQLYGSDPVFYHLQAIFIHSTIVLLVYFIIKFITNNKTASFTGAAIFASHPIHTEAVSYTTASMDTFGIMFFFASFYFYLRARILKEQPKLTIFLSAVFGFLAFFTYEVTLVLPILIVLYEIVFLKFKWREWRAYLNFVPYFMSIAFYVFIRFFWLHIGNRADYLGQIFIVSSNQSKISMPEFTLHYVKLLFFPLNLTVSHNLPSNLLNIFINFMFNIDSSGNLLAAITPAIFLFPIIFALLVIVFAFLIFRKQPVILFSISWFIITLLPVSNIIPQGAAFAERYLYIPSFGFSLLLGYLFVRSSGFNKQFKTRRVLNSAVWIFFTALILFYTYQTVKRNEDWRNEETIMIKAAQTNPNSFVANGALGIVRLKQGRFDEAIELFNKASENDPFPFNTKLHIGTAYLRKGDIDQAIKEYQEASEMRPESFTGYLFLADAYSAKGDYIYAWENYQKAISLNNQDPLIYYNQGVALMKQENYHEALASYQNALKLRPDYKNALLNTGFTYNKLNQPDKSIAYYKKVLELNNKELRAYFALAEMYESMGQKSKAKENYQIILSIDPENKLAKSKLEATK